MGIVATLACAVFGHDVLELLFGREFAAANDVLAILMLAQAAYLTGVTLLPTMVTLGLSSQFLNGVLLGTAAYVIVAATGVVPLGVVGIGLAHVVFNVVWAAYCWSKVIKCTRATKSGGLMLAAEKGAQH